MLEQPPLRFSLLPLTQHSYIRIVKLEWVEKRGRIVNPLPVSLQSSPSLSHSSEDLIKITSLRIAWI